MGLLRSVSVIEQYIPKYPKEMLPEILSQGVGSYHSIFQEKIMKTKKNYRIEVVTRWYSPDSPRQKVREQIYNFQDRELDPDRRNWPGHGDILDIKRSPEIYVRDYETAYLVLREIHEKVNDWKPLEPFKGSPEYLERYQIVSRDKNGRDEIEIGYTVCYEI